MPENFIGKSTKELDEAIRNCKTATEIAEVCKAAGERAGVLVRNRDGSVELRDSFAVTPQSPAQQQGGPLAEYADRLLRRAVTLDDGTIRVIEGYSDTGLDILEKALKGRG